MPPDTGSSLASMDAARVDGRRSSFGWFWIVSAAIVVLDQATKVLVQRLVPTYESRTIIPGFLDLVHVHNAGVAFGLLNGSAPPHRSVLTAVLAAAALVGIGYYARHIGREERIARVGLSFILGGAIGNLADRLRQGFVIDFVDVYWRGWHFWAFNVADAAITVGAALVFIDLLLVRRHAPDSV